MAKPAPIAPLILPPSPLMAKKKGGKKQVEVEASAPSQGIAAHPGQSMTGAAFSLSSTLKLLIAHALSGDASLKLLPLLVGTHPCILSSHFMQQKLWDTLLN